MNRGTMLTVDGVTRSVREWAELRGIRYNTLRSRLLLGWPADRAVREPVVASWGPKQLQAACQIITAFGFSQTAVEWERLSGLRVATIQQRMRRGWTAEDALATPVQDDRRHRPRATTAVMCGD